MLCLIFKAFYIHIVCDNKYLQTPSTVALYRFQIIDVYPFLDFDCIAPKLVLFYEKTSSTSLSVWKFLVKISDLTELVA